MINIPNTNNRILETKTVIQQKIYKIESELLTIESDKSIGFQNSLTKVFELLELCAVTPEILEETKEIIEKALQIWVNISDMVINLDLQGDKNTYTRGLTIMRLVSQIIAQPKPTQLNIFFTQHIIPHKASLNQNWPLYLQACGDIFEYYNKRLEECLKNDMNLSDFIHLNSVPEDD